MLQAVLLALEGSALGQAMRGTLWLYPLANTLHVLAIASLFGALLVSDLRLLGAARGLAAPALLGLTLPLAWAGFGLAALTGLMMFIADARVIAHNPFFQAKLVLLALAGLNALAFHRLGAGGDWTKLLAGLSLAVWVLVIVCGRAIAYW